MYMYVCNQIIIIKLALIIIAQLHVLKTFFLLTQVLLVPDDATDA
jgi:hypothetical protein